MNYEDILEAVQLVSVTEVISCLIFYLLPWKGRQQQKFYQDCLICCISSTTLTLQLYAHSNSAHIHFISPLDDFPASLQYNLPTALGV